MDPSRVVLVFIFLLLTIYLLSTDGCEMVKFVQSENEALKGHVIKTIVRSLVSLCWNECVWVSWCFSINVRATNHGTFECDLNNSSKSANPSRLVSRQGSQYHEFGKVDDGNCNMYECKRKEDLGEGWFCYGKAAIKLFHEIKNWTDARIFCQSLGGDLLSITSSHENDFVYDVFAKELNLTYGKREIEFSDVHWKFNGQEHGVSLYGTPGNVRYKSDDQENTLYFAGSDGWAEIPAFPLNPEGFTISLWVKGLNSTNAWMHIFHAYSNKGTVIQIYIKTSKGSVNYFLNDEKINGIKCSLYTWCHFAFSWNKTEQLTRFLKFGNNMGEKKPVLVNLTTTATHFLLGKNHPSQKRSFHGYIKHLMIFNRSLSVHEIQTSVYWHEQGAWIGLNDQDNSNAFHWSDDTPVSQFMSLPPYNLQPVLSGRKCAAIMRKNRKWLDKHCLEKKPFLCEKPAP